ncbi:MAG: FIST C-terminal domain-containing protein [Motiliproteus sp.]|nr:FIST C-terminal domain-containing protein [Motiliproteus sp.]
MDNSLVSIAEKLRIVTAGSSYSNIDTALCSARDALLQQLSAPPQLVVAYHSATADNAEVARWLAANFADSPLIGCTSCQGAMTEQGLHGADGFGIGLWAIEDQQGGYGVGYADLDDGPENAAQSALNQALESADRIGELPDLIWVHSSPGHEEQVISALNSLLGEKVPITGGSCADETIEGNWHCLANDQFGDQAVAVAVMFPSTEPAYAFQSGYSPTEHSGIVTRASGRTIYEIDHQPAAEVYNRWLKGHINDALEDAGNVLGLTTLQPLGREVGRIGSEPDSSIPYFVLLHPEQVTTERGLTLFAEVKEGEQLWLMEGSIGSLVSRAGRVVLDAQRSADLDPENVAGGLMIYCAGCMLTVGEQMPEVVDEINEAFAGKPFIGAFTFGEQGCLVGGENHHGNLMISTVLFQRE